MSKKKTKMVKQYLACKFTEEEKLALSQEMAQAKIKQDDLERALKEINAQYKSDITSQQNVISRSAQKIHDGYEYRDVDCEVEYNFPERGMKTITRLDTGETFVETMTYEEKNDLFINTEDKDEEEPEADGDNADTDNDADGEQPEVTSAGGDAQA